VTGPFEDADAILAKRDARSSARRVGRHDDRFTVVLLEDLLIFSDPDFLE
jgi:hypothetical protein